MVVNFPHINNSFESRQVHFRVYIFKALAQFRSLLKFNFLHTGLIKYFQKKLIKGVKKLYIISDELIVLSKKENFTASEKDHKFSELLLAKYSKIYSDLESVDFLSNNTVKHFCEITLDNILQFESRCRDIAFPIYEENSDDNSLNEFASSVSLGTLQA